MMTVILEMEGEDNHVNDEQMEITQGTCDPGNLSLRSIHIDTRYLYFTSTLHGTEEPKLGETESSSECASCLLSPNVKKSCPFMRLPPDSCERVTVVEELSESRTREASHLCPVTPNMFVFKPSQGSAFCPLMKKYEHPLNYTSTSPTLSHGLVDE